MARKASGKRSVGADGSVRVRGNASNGEGSIYRDSDGAWRATYFVAGERRPRRVRGKTRDEALSDIARYVGHAGEATTAGYVRSLRERPKATAATAAAMLDPRAAVPGS